MHHNFERIGYYPIYLIDKKKKTKQDNNLMYMILIFVGEFKKNWLLDIRLF